MFCSSYHLLYLLVRPVLDTKTVYTASLKLKYAGLSQLAFIFLALRTSYRCFTATTVASASAKQASDYLGLDLELNGNESLYRLGTILQI